MDFDMADHGDVTVITLKMETLEAGMTHDFKAAMCPVITAHKQLVLDMARVRFVDSSGCGALLYCLRKAQEAGGTVRLCSVGKPLAALFKVIRLDRKLEIFDTPQTAISAFGGSGR